ncbi:MAG: hypothetical protein CL920_12850 [Deltaproteobacteria bacterium]|nr:hypothetical protein [Deltaproteobacteria bacterium]|tara:strand:+ start:1860 stop:2885 length:1026 start_codon:yes stop_codon:yes gene_type:complete
MSYPTHNTTPPAKGPLDIEETAPAQLRLCVGGLCFALEIEHKALRQAIFARFHPFVERTHTQPVDARIQIDFIDPAASFWQQSPPLQETHTAKHFGVTAGFSPAGHRVMFSSYMRGHWTEEGQGTLALASPTDIDAALQPGWIEREGVHLQMASAPVLHFETFFTAMLIHQLLRHDGLLLHASGVVSDNKAFIFAGASGAGKSTAAKNSPHAQLLSDELVILRPNKRGTFQAYGTPFYSTCGRLGEAIDAPLHNLFFLVQSPDNHIATMAPHMLYKQMLQIICIRHRHHQETQQLLQLVDRLVPYIKALHLRPDPSFWALLHPEKEHEYVQTQRPDTPSLT